MRLQSQISREYKENKYKKYWIVIPNKLIEELDWRDSSDLEAEIKRGKLVIESVGYRINFYDKDGNRIGSELLTDRDEFLEKANPSKTKDEKWDTEISIVPVKSDKSGGMSTSYRDYGKKENYYGEIKKFKKILDEFKS